MAARDYGARLIDPSGIAIVHSQTIIDPSLPEQNGRRFADDIFRCIFVNEMVCILIKISLIFFPKGPIDNDPSLV